MCWALQWLSGKYKVIALGLTGKAVVCPIPGCGNK
jgi:hypothetical protein